MVMTTKTSYGPVIVRVMDKSFFRKKKLSAELKNYNKINIRFMPEYLILSF